MASVKSSHTSGAFNHPVRRRAAGGRVRSHPCQGTFSQSLQARDIDFVRDGAINGFDGELQADDVLRSRIAVAEVGVASDKGATLLYHPDAELFQGVDMFLSHCRA